MFDGLKKKMQIVKGIKGIMDGDDGMIAELAAQFLTPENIAAGLDVVRKHITEFEEQHQCEAAALIRHTKGGNPYIDILKIENNQPAGLIKRYTVNELPELVKMLTNSKS